MRYVRIFLLNFQEALQYRLRSFVWFLTSLTGPVFILIFWNAAISSGNKLSPEWSLDNLILYYLLFIIAGSLLVAHVEEVISREDIQKGQIVKYLIKPFSYYWIKFFEEAPWRLMQGFYGFLVFAIVIYSTQSLRLHMSSDLILINIGIIILAYFISFTYKMIIGLLAFWFTDTFGLFQINEVVFIIFSGIIMPLDLLPGFLKSVAYFLPFSYILYFPVIVFIGKLSINEAVRIFLIQIVWLTLLIVIYKLLYKKGIRTFTAVGQ